MARTVPARRTTPPDPFTGGTRPVSSRVLALDEVEVGRAGRTTRRWIRGPAPRLPTAARPACLDRRDTRRRPGPAESGADARPGCLFTAEYATEAAALCNPSAVAHPDQSGLGPGQLRVAVSLRAIGEGHVSSIAFCVAVIGPGPNWSFTSRELPVVAGEVAPAIWSNEQFRAVLTDQAADAGQAQAAASTNSATPCYTHCRTTSTRPIWSARCRDTSVESARPARTRPAKHRPAAPGRLLGLSRGSSRRHDARPADPATVGAEESGGMEDARFTRFIGRDGVVEYRATYTAYDGRQIAPRLLLSPDLRRFRVHRLAGPAARNKGMALFPRLVGGRHLALCRTDGESTSLADSTDGFAWAEPRLIHEPSTRVGDAPGRQLRTADRDRSRLAGPHPRRRTDAQSTRSGRCCSTSMTRAGSSAGWSGRCWNPIADEQDGYVPNVVYSCGGLVHDERLWLPYGIERLPHRRRVGADLDDLLDELAATAVIPLRGRSHAGEQLFINLQVVIDPSARRRSVRAPGRRPGPGPAATPRQPRRRQARHRRRDSRSPPRR